MNKLIEIDELKKELKETQKLYLEALNIIDKAIEWVKKNQYYFPKPNELLIILGDKE